MGVVEAPAGLPEDLADLQRRVKDLEGRQAAPLGLTQNRVLLRGVDAFGTYEPLCGRLDQPPRAIIERGAVASLQNPIYWAEIPQTYTHLEILGTGNWGGLLDTQQSRLRMRYNGDAAEGHYWSRWFNVADNGFTMADHLATNSGMVGSFSGVGQYADQSRISILIPFYNRPTKHNTQTLFSRGDQGTAFVSGGTVLWARFEPITSIMIWGEQGAPSVAGAQWNYYHSWELWGVGPVTGPPDFPPGGDAEHLNPPPAPPPPPPAPPPPPQAPPQITLRVGAWPVPAGQRFGTGVSHIAGGNFTVPRSGRIRLFGTMTAWMYAWNNNEGYGQGTRLVASRVQGVASSTWYRMPGSIAHVTFSRDDTWAIGAGTRVAEWYCQMAGGNVLQTVSGNLYADWTGPAY